MVTQYKTRIVREPRIDERLAQPYMGIRVQTPFKGMFQVADKLLKQLFTWAKSKGIEPAGPTFLRFYVVAMDGIMDIEVGLPVTAPLPDEGDIKASFLPAGRYASLVFVGNGYIGNKTLIEWAAVNGIQWDHWEDPHGDAFRCRTEAYLTDPRHEHRKTKWEVEVAMKIAESS
jgi:effector-binding domain-containing protein